MRGYRIAQMHFCRPCRSKGFLIAAFNFQIGAHQSEIFRLHRYGAESRLDQPSSSRTALYAILLLLFAASGCAALIYEVVWYQLLQLAIGSTAIPIEEFTRDLYGRPLYRGACGYRAAAGRRIPCGCMPVSRPASPCLRCSR